MADNLAQFEERFRRYVREETATTSFWKQPFFRQMFNASYRRRCSQLIMAYEGWFTQVAMHDLTRGQSTYGNPPGLLRYLKVQLVRSDGRLVPLRRDERQEGIVIPDSSSPTGDHYLPTWRPLSNGFILEPTPNETVSNGIRLEYSGVPVFLNADADKLHPSFPEIFDELLVLDTVVLALEAEGVHESGPQAAIYRMRSEWEMDFERHIEQRSISRDRIDPFVPFDPDC